MYNGQGSPEYYMSAPPAGVPQGYFVVAAAPADPNRPAMAVHHVPAAAMPVVASLEDLQAEFDGAHRGGGTPQSIARRSTPPASHEDMEDDDWNVLSKKIDSCVRLDTQFFEYPKQELFTTPPTSGSIDDDELTGTKVFLGGMRFEVVQMGRHLIRWLLMAACGVTLSPNRILIHRKSKSGKLPAPTGCASVYVASEADVCRLIDMNQRIFCSEKGIHVASSAEKMNELILEKVILDITDGRARGPTHPMIIERAYSGTTTPTTSRPMTPTNGSTDSLTELASAASSSLQGSFTEAARGHLASGGTTPSTAVPDHPLYNRYEGDTKLQPGILEVTTDKLTNPTELFVGGLCYEATRTFVAWMFTTLMNVKLHPLSVTLYSDPQTGSKRGCAQVRVEETDYETAVSFTRRLLCDPHGVYVADTPDEIVDVQKSRERNESAARGPSHAVVIEKRRNTTNGHHRSSNNSSSSMPHHHHSHQGAAHHHHHHHAHYLHHHPHGLPPPPPQYGGMMVAGSLPPYPGPPPPAPGVAGGGVIYAPIPFVVGLPPAPTKR